MWIRTYSKVYTDLKKEQIWSLWTDVNNWHKWHLDLDWCKLEGPFSVGNSFLLKPKGVKPVKIDLVKILSGKEFTDCTHFFGARMYDTHKLEETSEGLRLTNIISVTGPLKFLWIKLVAQNIADTVPQEMEILVKHAKSLKT